MWQPVLRIAGAACSSMKGFEEKETAVIEDFGRSETDIPVRMTGERIYIGKEV